MVHRLVECLQQPPGGLLGVGDVGQLHGQDPELLAAAPRGDVGGADARVPPSATAARSSSPAAWPMQTFTLQKSSRSRNSTASEPAHLRVAMATVVSSTEATAVGQTGERVVIGLVVSRAFSPAGPPRHAPAARPALRGGSARAATHLGAGRDDAQATAALWAEAHQDRTRHHRSIARVISRTGPSQVTATGVRLGQATHRRVQRGRAEQQVRDQVHGIERTARDVRLIEVSGARRPGRRRGAATG